MSLADKQGFVPPLCPQKSENQTTSASKLRLHRDAAAQKLRPGFAIQVDSTNSKSLVLYKYICIYIYISVSLSLYLSIYIYIYMYVYTYTDTHTHTNAY